MKRFIVSILILLSLGVNGQVIIASAPYKPTIASSNGFARSITVDHTKVPNTDQTDFPVLVSGTYTYLKSVGNGGKVQNVNGYDIYFATSAGGAAMPFQLVSWDATTGTIQAWVKVSTLTTAEDAVFWLNYGNPTITTYQGNNTGTWNSAYKAVWHMEDVITAAEQTLTDATSQVTYKSKVDFGSWGQSDPVTGKIGNAEQINPTGSGFDNSFRGTSIPLTTTFTAEAWVNFPATPGESNRIFGDTTELTYVHFFGAQYHFDKSGSTKITTTNTVSTGTWYYYVLTRNGSTLTLYENGTQITTNSNGVDFTINAIGARNGSLRTANIIYDEARISNTTRSADWIATCYNNQNSPSTFYTVGGEVSL